MFPTYYSQKDKMKFREEGGFLVSKNQKIPIVNEIPRFVESGAYASLFGDQWKAFRKTQLDSFTGTTISRKRVEKCLGELSDSIRGKLVLEAGCGAGRFTEILLDKGAYLISSDISTAVEVNRENCPVNERHKVIQADINDMPFEPEIFDIVICIGVIQHTPNTEKTIEDLFRLVKKGGHLVIDHYTFEKSYFLRTAFLYRRFLKKKNPDFTIAYTKKLVNRYLPLHKRFSKNKLLSIFLNRISPVITYYRAFPELNEQMQEEWAYLDTHDSLTDWYKRFRSKGSIRKTLENLGATDIYCEYGGNGVEARCKKSN
ncbi:MAG: methyltransferase domain-containing protein [Bacteroidetes bacterium]|nr:methyltransferase domain-containing protein [Bacteroidota bacterium]